MTEAGCKDYSSVSYHLLVIVEALFYLFLSHTAKRLPRLQPVPNPSGMVLTDTSADRSDNNTYFH